MTITPIDTLERHYFYNEETKVIYYSEPMREIPYEPSLIYLGSSDNKKVKMAAAHFMKNDKVKSGYKLEKLW